MIKEIYFVDCYVQWTISIHLSDGVGRQHEMIIMNPDQGRCGAILLSSVTFGQNLPESTQSFLSKMLVDSPKYLGRMIRRNWNWEPYVFPSSRTCKPARTLP